jgi:transposase
MPLFLAPWFLIAGLAATVPIALHLLWRRRPKPVPFPTLRFLREACVRTRRSRNITQFLVLLLRVLVLLLLAFAFARPKFMLGGGLSAGRRTALIVLDTSASMHFRHGDRTALDLARERADRLLATFGPTDRVGLVAPGLSEPRLVFPPSSELQTVAQKLADVRPTFARVNLVQALTEFLDRLPEGTDRRGLEVHLFSDFQESSFPAAELAALGARLDREAMLLLLNQVRPGAVDNAGIAGVEAVPAVLVGAGELRADVTVQGSDDLARKVSLSLVLDGQPQETVAAEPPAGGTLRESLRGSVRDALAAVQGRVELGRDAFELDNVFHFAVPRMAGVPVGLVGGERSALSPVPETFFLRAALNPGGRAQGWFSPRAQGWDEFAARDLEGMNVFLLCNPPELTETLARKIEAVLAGGGTVVLFPGPNGTLTRPLPFACLAGLAVSELAAGTGDTVALVPTRAPSTLEKRLMTLYPMRIAFPLLRRLAVSTRPERAEAVFEYPDGTPFLLQVPAGPGRLWLCSVSADRAWSDFPVTPPFLILVQELLRDAAGRAQPALASAVGQAVAVPWTEQALEVAFELVTPSGQARGLPLTRRLAEDPFVVSAFDQPGVYQLRRGDSTRLIAINIPPEETALVYPDVRRSVAGLAPARVLAAQNWQEQEDAIRLARAGRPFWPELLAAAFFLALAEQFLSNWRSRAKGSTWLPRLAGALFRRTPAVGAAGTG